MVSVTQHKNNTTCNKNQNKSQLPQVIHKQLLRKLRPVDQKSQTTREHVCRSLYGEVQVISFSQLHQKQSVFDGVESNSVNHFHGQHMVLAACGIVYHPEQFIVQLLKESAGIVEGEGRNTVIL